MKDATPRPAAILVGSHAYGKPRKKSDIDLVVLADQALLDELADLAETELQGDYLSPDPAEHAAFRFGRLNLILVSNPRLYQTWVQGTQQLKKKRPVSRERAVALFRRLRQAAGFHLLQSDD